MSEDGYTRITLRIPDPLHSKLTAEAARTSKSMNAEIIARLEGSFPSAPIEDKVLKSLLEAELKSLNLKRNASGLLDAFGGLTQELPKDAEGLANLVERKSRAAKAYADEEQRIRELFKDAEDILKTKAPDNG